MTSKVRVLPSPPPYTFSFGWRATPKLRQERRGTDAVARYRPSLDCFVAFAFRLRSASFGGRGRSLSYDGQVAPRHGVTSISNKPPRSRGAMGPSFAKPIAHKSEGAGNAGCTMHPQPRVRNKTKHTSVVTTVTPEITRHSPRNGFNGLFRALPGDEFVLSPSSAD